MTVYPEMNNKIVDLLRMGDTPVELYAAQRIEELELKNKELIDRILEIITHEQQLYIAQAEKFLVCERIKNDVLKLQGGEQE